MISLSGSLVGWIDPVAVHIGPLAVRWYGIAYLLAFAAAYAILWHAVRARRLAMTKAALDELLAWLVLGVLVGGRAGWWLFYHRADASFDAWYEPLAIWHGGMSFHGGLAGVAIVTFLWSRYRRVRLWNLLDHLAIAAPLGLMLGRIANFINAELVGRVSNMPWAITFPGDTLSRHPSQIYEAVLEGPVLLLCLILVRKAFLGRDGVPAAAFLVLYGVFRFVVEFTRQPDPQIGFVGWGWLTMGQVLSGVIAAIGAVLMLKQARLETRQRRSRDKVDPASSRPCGSRRVRRQACG